MMVSMHNASTDIVRKSLKIAVYLLGAFYGFVGYSVLWFTQFMFRVNDKDSAIFRDAMGAVVVLLGIYLLYVAYLILWRFSAAGLKHTCIVSAFYAWTLMARKDSLQPSNELLVWGSLIGVSIVAVLIYRSLNRLLISGMR
jgi:hypothetical protein